MRFPKLLYLILAILPLLIPVHCVTAGEVKMVSTVQELMETSGPGQPDGLTVLIRDGEYRLPRRIIIDGSQVTYKGLNNDRDKVKLLGKGGPFGKVHNIFSIKGNRIYIRHLSLGEVSNHGIQIHGENNADHIFLQHLRFFNIKEQMLKGSYDKKKPGQHTDFGLVEDCIFEFPEGFAYQSYTGGIDIHHGENWVIKNNRFSNIRTKDGKLTEGAIHFWNGSKNTHITNNTITHCDRGIMLGFDNSRHHGGLIHKNRIHTVADTGIYLCNATDITVSQNTVFIDSAYPNAIEYRFNGSQRNHIHDNTTNKRIVSRNNGEAQVYGNRISRDQQWASDAISSSKDAPLALRENTPSTPIKIRALHKDGQTFLVFQEAGIKYPSGPMTYESFSQFKDSTQNKIRYKIYMDTVPIKTVKYRPPIATLRPFTGINQQFYGRYTNRKYKKKLVIRYVLPNEKEPLPKGAGLFVHKTGSVRNAYYAVTLVKNGKEDLAVILGENSLSIPVSETIGKGKPVLQRIEKPDKFLYQKQSTLYFFTRWETKPNTADSCRPYDYLVAVPKNVKKPAPVGIHMHGWGGNLMAGYAWWQNVDAGAILLASNQEPYDWWTGYLTNYYSKTRAYYTLTERVDRESDANLMVKPYTTNRIFSFLDYLERESIWQIDRKRTFTAGSSMGGSGSIMMAIRHPQKIAWARSWVGVHKPDLSPEFKSSYERVWEKQKKNIPFENGKSVWEYYDDVAYLYKYPKKEIGLLCFSNGKNDKGIGWKQAVLFFKALQETRRPHVFVWGQKGHGQRAIMPMNSSQALMPIDVTTRSSLPAFTRCSLDDNPGNGYPLDGDPAGQVNQWLFWETQDMVDQIDQWSMTIGLMATAPSDHCCVDITPRRIQHFKVNSEDRIVWENKTLADRLIESGQIIADGNGLITISNILITKGKNRITLKKNAAIHKAVLSEKSQTQTPTKQTHHF